MCTVRLFKLQDLYCRHKSHSLSAATESTKVKNGFGADRRNPLASAGCFTAPFSSMAQRVAVAMNHRFSATAPNAQGLCQTHSVSQTARLFRSSTAMATALPASHDNIIQPTDGHGDRNTSVDTSQSTASDCWCTLWEVRGERGGVPVNSHKVNQQSCTLNAPSATQEKMNPVRESAGAFLKVAGAWPLFKWPCQL